MSDPPNDNSDVVDCAIIGGGPVGLFAAFYAGLRKMSVKIIDSLESLGGQLVTLYPEKYVYDVAGFPKILAKDLATNLIEQGMQYGAVECLGEQVQRLDFDDATRIFTLPTDKAVHRARSVLIAAGVGAFVPKVLPLAEEQKFHGRGLHYGVRSVADFAGKRVLIVGGGDSAVDWANMLSPVASHLTLIHRRHEFRAHEDSVAKMRAGTSKIRTPYELRAIEGDGHVEAALIFDNADKEKPPVRLGVDEVVVNIGFDTSLGPILDFGLEMHGSHIAVDSMMHTSRPGVFAAGDVAAFAGKLKLIATGFGEACIAINFAKQYLDPAARAFPGHSSNMAPPPSARSATH